jgi:hypothetical protein
MEHRLFGSGGPTGECHVVFPRHEQYPGSKDQIDFKETPRDPWSIWRRTLRADDGLLAFNSQRLR